jgi:plasmid rolling circle replication initiator protein Rep
MNNKAKRKIISQTMVLGLIKIAEEQKNPKMLKKYWNTYHCQNRLLLVEGRTYGEFCKNRICTLCNANRKADKINNYLPILNKWPEPYFVTLTARSIGLRILGQRIINIQRAFKIIISRSKTRYRRGIGIKLVGIKSIECNFNPIAKTYNPHLHLIVQDKETADYFVNEWLNLWTKKHAERWSQHKEKVFNNEKILIEVIKYGSKIFTEPDLKKKEAGVNTPTIYLKALHNILDAMDGKRLFDRFGFNLPERNKTTSIRNVTDYDVLEFDSFFNDWININKKELVTGYNMPADLQFLLDNYINLEAQ